MKKQLKTILLLDDNKATNFINKKFINEVGCAEQIMDFQSGTDALSFLGQANPMPELIFIDINMPIMDAWEFLGEYKQLRSKKQAKTVVILLSTSLSPKDAERAQNIPLIDGIKLKPLSVTSINEVLSEFF